MIWPNFQIKKWTEKTVHFQILRSNILIDKYIYGKSIKCV